MQSHIRTGRVALVHPPHKVSAEISRDYLQRWLRGKGKSDELITKLNSLLDRSQIKTRYILLSPDEVLEPRDFHTTNQQYIKASIELGTRAVREALECVPPELCGDIYERGVVLTGGVAFLRKLDEHLHKETGLPVVKAGEPLATVVIGAGKLLSDRALLSKVAVN